MKQTGRDNEQRLDDLEVRMAFLEKGIDDLDQVIQQLAIQLEATRTTVGQLREQMHSDTLTVRGDPMDEVPPHY